MKNKMKFILITFLMIFTISVAINCVSAANTTFHLQDGDVDVTLSDEQINEVVKDKNILCIDTDDKFRTFKVNYFKKIKYTKTVKVPVYKYKTVKKYHYLYKYKLATVYRYNDYDTYETEYNNAWKTPKGYKYIGTHFKDYSNGWNFYIKYRTINKKAYYTKVKYIHHYKKVKKTYYKDSKPYSLKVKCEGSANILPVEDNDSLIRISIYYSAPDIKGYNWHMAYGSQYYGVFDAYTKEERIDLEDFY